MRRFLRYALLFILVFAAFVFLLNTDLLAPESQARPLIIAHRGLGQPASTARSGPIAATGSDRWSRLRLDVELEAALAAVRA